MNRGSKVRIMREHVEVAECESATLHPESTRERVRQHVQQTGHTARYVVEATTIYSPLPSGGTP